MWRTTKWQMLIFFSACANSLLLQAGLPYALKAPSYAANEAFYDNHPDNHIQTGFAMLHRSKVFLILMFRLPFCLIWPKKGVIGWQMYDCYAHCVRHVAIKTQWTVLVLHNNICDMLVSLTCHETWSDCKRKFYFFFFFLKIHKNKGTH